MANEQQREGPAHRAVSRRGLLRGAAVVGGGALVALAFGLPRAPVLAAVHRPPVPAAPPRLVSQTAKRGGVLNVARLNDAPSLDPHKESAIGRSISTQNIYSLLVQTDENLRVVPDLAERWEISSDGRTYTFYLRRGVKFHNGRDLVADDVKYSLERILNPNEGAYGRSFISSIDTVEAIDPLTVRLNLKNVDSALLVSLASSFCAIVPKEEVERAGGSLNRTAVGSGPFIFEEWVPGQTLKLRRNPDYYVQGLPYLDGITFQVIPEEAQVIAQLRTGNIHLFTLQDNNNYAIVRNASNLDAMRSQRLGFEYININNKRPPFDKLEVRQAMSWAIDRREVVEVAYSGLGNMVAPIPPAMKDYALDPETIPEFKPDLDRARALLAQAGLPNGFKTELLTITGWPTLILGAQVVADQLRRVGIDVEIKQMEYGAWISDWRVWNFDMSMNATGGNSDPDPLLYPRLHSKGANNNNWEDPEVDALLEEGKSILDQQRRIEHYKRLQRVLIEKVPQLWLGQPDLIDVMKKSVKGYVPHPSTFMPGLPATWLDQ